MTEPLLVPHTTGTTLPPPRLAPVATTRTWMPALQSLRGVAALWVALYHIQVWLFAAGLPLLAVPSLRLGWLGVDLFFVLSAYLLGQPFLDGRAPPTRRFLADRFLRIAPPYYAAFAITVVVMMWVFRDTWTGADAGWSLVFLNNLRHDWFIAVNPAFWSLAVEMQFYLLLPFMARLFRGRWWSAWTAAFIAIACLWRGLLWVQGGEQAIHLTNFALPGFLGHFALGLAICRLRTLDRPVGTGARRTLFLAGLPLAIVPALLWIPRGSVFFGEESLAGCVLVRPLAACGFALIVLATASGGWVARALAWGPLDWLGRISYSLYLVHIPAQLAVWPFVTVENLWLWAALEAVASVVGGALLYAVVEAPAERWRRARKSRQRAAAAGASSG